MELRHNGRPSSIAAGEVTSFARVGDAIAACTGQTDGTGEVLTGLRIDGRDVPEDEWDEARALPPSEVSLVEIEAAPVDEIALRSLRGTCEYAPRVGESLGQVAEWLRCGEPERACALYATCLDALSVVLFVVQTSVARLGPAAARLDGLDATLAPWLEALAESQERGDWLAVADVLEFEVVPVVDEWVERMREVDAAARSEALR